MRNKIQYVLLAASLVFAFQASVAGALTVDDLTGSGNNASFGSDNNLGNSAGNSGNSGFAYSSGTLLNDGGTVYLIRGAQKIPFATAAAFTGLGYSFANVVSGDSSGYSPNGYIITTPFAEHPWGSWLSYKGTIYYLTSQGMVGVPSPDIFTANGGGWNMVLPANKYDIAQLTANPDLPVLTNGDQRVYSTPSLSFSGSTPLSYNFSGSTSTPAAVSTLAINSPLAGAQLLASSNFPITWTGGDASVFVNLNLISQAPCNSGANAADTCASIQNIAAGVPNNGAYSWQVPAAFSGIANGYQIQISYASQPASTVLGPTFSIVSSLPVSSNTNTNNNSSATTSLPTLALNGVSGTLTVGAQTLGKFVVTAPTSTSVTLISIPLLITASGGAYISTAANNIVVIDDTSSLTLSSTNPAFGLVGGGSGSTTVTVSTNNTIAAGTSRVYDIIVPAVGNLGSSGSSSLTLQLTGVSGFTVNGSPVTVGNPTNQVSVHN